MYLTSIIGKVTEETLRDVIIRLVEQNICKCSFTSYCKISANDAKIYSPVSTTTQAQQTENDIDRMVDWSKMFLLKFSENKCKVM